MTKGKHIAHVVARESVIHNFFYRDEYSIYRSYKSPLTHAFNWLFIGEHDSVKNFNDAKDFAEHWYSDYLFNHSKTCIAAINRKDKILVITGKHDNLAFELESAIPNKEEWKVYKVYDEITNPWIAEKKYEYERIKGNLQYLISEYIKSNIWIFRLAYTDKYYCGDIHINVTFTDDKFADNIAVFCKENNVSNTLLNTRLFDSLSFPYYIGWSYTSSETIVLSKKQIPTAQQIIDNTILSTKGLEELKVKMFYSKYCRGTILNYNWKQVKNNWNTKFAKSNDKVANRARQWDDGEVIKWLSEYREAGHGDPRWQQVVAHFYKKYEEVIVNINKINAAKSEENRREALREFAIYDTEQERIERWRQHKQIFNREKTVSYMYWHPSTFKQRGYWKNVKIYPYEYDVYKFSNTQLRLGNNCIETSRHCTVPVDDAVKLYKLFISHTTRKSIIEIVNNKDDVNIDFKTFDIKCGNYKLNWFKYTNKVTDTNVPLNYKEWCVCIGCHHIWIDDFIDFVHYYHLEKDFGIK